MSWGHTALRGPGQTPGQTPALCLPSTAIPDNREHTPAAIPVTHGWSTLTSLPATNKGRSRLAWKIVQPCLAYSSSSAWVLGSCKQKGPCTDEHSQADKHSQVEAARWSWGHSNKRGVYKAVFTGQSSGVGVAWRLCSVPVGLAAPTAVARAAAAAAAAHQQVACAAAAAAAAAAAQTSKLLVHQHPQPHACLQNGGRLHDNRLARLALVAQRRSVRSRHAGAQRGQRGAQRAQRLGGGAAAPGWVGGWVGK